jgi:polyribonucleotide nucleotidyltransferase
VVPHVIGKERRKQKEIEDATGATLHIPRPTGNASITALSSSSSSAAAAAAANIVCMYCLFLHHTNLLLLRCSTVLLETMQQPIAHCNLI